MELKRYQGRVVREVEAYLDALAKEQEAGAKHASLDAWGRIGALTAYRERKNGLGEDLPSVCLKVPTGGGKTLIATLVLGLIHRTILRARNGAGLVLWVVPSEQIYSDALRALRDRHHYLRESLEGAIGRRIEVWEKHEIARLTPTQLASALNVFVIQLASISRKSKEQLKYFEDSGGNIVQHFPPEDDEEAHKKLKTQIPNLDAIKGTSLLKTSLANLVRRCQPAVIVDEGHKAASDLALGTIEGMNPSIVVELSATPAPAANVLVSVSGKELLDEEMIKLPINVVNTAAKTWKECLARAADQRKELAALAKKTRLASGRFIRPIVLVQVERTGKDQRDGKHVHAEDVKEELIERHGVAADRIAIKTSSRNDIENIDLLDEGCRIEWIITKAALQEGWDCPYAYVLISLNAGESKRAMTQLVGRVLRQPEAQRTGEAALDESYVFCLKRSAGEVVKEVKDALEKEGYEGDYVSQRDGSTEGAKAERPVARLRKEFTRNYLKPFVGKIFLPRFCVELAKEHYEELDYFAHLLARVDPYALDVSSAGEWAFEDELKRARNVSFRVTLGEGVVEPAGDDRPSFVEPDESVHDWLSANLGADYLGLKESRSIVSRASKALLGKQPQLRGSLGLVKHLLREKMAGLVQQEVDRATEKAFAELFESKKIKFYLHCVECRFEIPKTITLRALQKKMVRDDNGPLQRSLFDYVADDLNFYEREVALVLDRDEQVLWWYRNLVGAHNFAIQGYRRDRIYPDFVVQQGKKQANQHVVVIESKGRQLSGNLDTEYKRNIADYFTKAGKQVKWQQLASGFADRVFRFQVIDQGDYPGEQWREELKKLLGG